MIEDATKDEIIEQILQNADQTFREWLHKIPKEVLSLNLTMPQFKIVILLFLEGSLRMSYIASQLGVSLATATGIVDRLVEHELVVREAQPEDRRVVLCHLSEKGEQLISGVWKVAKKNITELLTLTDTPQLEQINKVLKVLLKAARTANINQQNNQSTAKLTVSS